MAEPITVEAESEEKMHRYHGTGLFNSKVSRWLPISIFLFGAGCASDDTMLEQGDDASQETDESNAETAHQSQQLAIAPTDVYGAIGDRYRQLGGASSWLGLPTSEEIVIPEGGRVRRFQRGDIYWWPDTGARDVGRVVIDYTGFHCFGETDIDGTSDDDEVYATGSVVGADRIARPFQSQVHHSVNRGDSRFDVIRIYQGPPSGVTINVLLTEWSNGDPARAREVINGGLSALIPVIGTAASAVPVVGPVLGPAAVAAAAALKDDAANALVGLGLADRPLGSDIITLTQKQMVLLASRPEGHWMFGPIPWRVETALLNRYGASYKAFFNIYPG